MEQAKYLKVEAEVRYWEDASVNGIEDEDGDLIPLRKGSLWCPVIDIKTGLILNWPNGTQADVHYKVCDAGVYSLLDNKYQPIATKDGYVPSCLAPNGSGYGDYIILNIDQIGHIKGWDHRSPFEDDWPEGRAQEGE